MSEIIEGFEPSNKIKLLPCPFCGGEAEIFGDKKHWIYCPNCCSETKSFKTKKEAIERWNTRRPMERIIYSLEARYDRYFHGEDDYCEGYNNAIGKAINIVKEVGGIE